MTTRHRPKVLDVSVDIAGRYAGRLLARHGFEVTRATIRHVDARPSMVGDGVATETGSAFERFLDGGKEMVALDLTTADGVNQLQELIRATDTVLSTFGPDAASALGLDAPAVHQINPDAAVVSVTPYGLRGPDAGAPATEKTLFAHAGAMLISGPPSAFPLCPNLPIPSMLGGIYAAMATLLRHLGPPSDGVELDVSLIDVLTANLERVLSYYTYLEAVPYRGVGSGRIEQSAGGGYLRAADGYFYIFSGYQWFDRVLEMVGRSDLIADAGQVTSRREQTGLINAAVAEAMAGLTVDQLAKRAQQLRMPSGPVATTSSLLEDPQLQARQTFTRTPAGELDIDEPWRILPGRSDTRPAPEPRPALSGLPLAGVRVLDLTHAFAGPTSSRILAEAGADVIKIESVTRLDLLARGMIPYDNDTSAGWWERSGYFADRNLGKRAITLDMSVPDGRELFLRLVETADVVVANFTPRVLRDWGLEPERLLELNPRLVVLMMTGFGLTGPRSENPALAGTMEAASGFSTFVRATDDEPPGALGFNFGDMVSGVFGAAAVLFALHEQRATGAGQIIDFACAEAPIPFLACQILEQDTTAAEPSCRTDYLHAGTHLLIAAGEPPGGQRWVLAYLASTGPTVDGLVADVGLDLVPAGAPTSVVPLQSGLSRDLLVARLQAKGVVAVPLSDAEDRWYDQGLRSRDFFVFATRRSVTTMPHARGLPVLWDGAALGPPMSSVPLLGEHNWEVLGRPLGLSREAFAGLEDRGAIGARPVGKLPKTFQVPLALDYLQELGLLRRCEGARSALIASFANTTTNGRPKVDRADCSD
jgi:crotonobetainyl-CoA:carnitine CoA-transferase CaiB-like acyl-CoA transferase